MPASLDSPPGEIRVAPSGPLELMWLVHLLGANKQHQADFADLEPLRSRFGPPLTQLWDDGMPALGTDIIVLADRSGTLLESDNDRFFGRLEAAAIERRPLPPLRSESADERAAIGARLERLAQSKGLRSRYADLLQEIWTAAASSWTTEG